MKKLLMLFSSLMIGALALTSCITGDYEEVEDHIVSYGVLYDESGFGFRNTILTDSGQRLFIYESNVSQEEIDKQKERVLVNYTILQGPDQDGLVYIRLNGFYELLTDVVPHFSQLTDEQRAALGGDPVNVTTASISGGYLNMPLIVLYGSSAQNIAHSISLVYDDQSSTEDHYIFHLYHNAKNDHNANVQVGKYSSFPLTQVIPEDGREVTVELRWRWYHGSSVEPCMASAKWKRGAKEVVTLTGVYGTQM